MLNTLEGKMQGLLYDKSVSFTADKADECQSEILFRLDEHISNIINLKNFVISITERLQINNNPCPLG